MRKNMRHILIQIIILLMLPMQINAQKNPQDLIYEKKPNQPEDICPEIPIIKRIIKYKIQPKDTLESIANQYNILPDTIVALNSNVLDGKVREGEELLIPPINGFFIKVNPGQTYTEIAAQYVINAGLIFEANGCQEKPPEYVFIPTSRFAKNNINEPPIEPNPNNSNPNNNNQTNNNQGGLKNPLNGVMTILFDYEWQTNPDSGKRVFHSGIDLMAFEENPVFVVADGEVAFAGKKGNYGNLVVVNHPNGMQTRYAHLSKIYINEGKKVIAGEPLGTVGNTGKPDIKQSHLHFEIRMQTPQGWMSEDPKKYFNIK
ncbi:MAG TPA: M23 family metallopeptidase [Allocoleopsis sp.]